jgi:hypothetical protein
VAERALIDSSAALITFAGGTTRSAFVMIVAIITFYADERHDHH